ncbi:MAG: DUF4458 domain-containing protein [Bacteroidaceae bacterium]|nr:DUF4458 domain-containing protein [Bacteroidaceae bacterium]
MNKKYIYMFTLLIASLFGSIGCSEKDDFTNGQYGFVQFKLYKNVHEEKQNAVATRAVDRLEYLSDAHKIKVFLKYDGNVITQTMVLNSYNKENAEYGLRSEKLSLLAGKYSFIGYTLYDKYDKELLSRDISDCTIDVVSGGLKVQDVYVDAVERGLVSFKLVKEWNKSAVTRAAVVEEDEEAYPFNKIKVVDITVQNTFTKEKTTIKKVRVDYVEDFADNNTPGKNPEISYALCDTVVWLKAGTYRVEECTTYSDKNGRSVLGNEYNLTSETFEVKDNILSKDVTVPINLTEEAEYIKDYIALKKIWEALDGENWSYAGEAEKQGTNWNFNKDIDMWGEQPGVKLNAEGRVEMVSLEGFGAKGVVPDAIGQLTELSILYLGSHSEMLGGHSQFGRITPNMTAEEKQALRMDYAEKVLEKDFRLNLSEIWQKTIELDDTERPLKKGVSLKHIQFGDMTNGIEGISKAVMRCTKLEQFYIANSPVTIDGFFREIGEDSPFYEERNSLTWENMTTLFDVEIFNCPNLTSLPMDMLGNVPELQMLNIACCKGISGDQLKADWEAFINGKSGAKIQVIYMGFNNLKEFPVQTELEKMVKLGMIDCTNNQIETLHPFGKSINLAKVYLDYNKLKEIPVAADGFFCGYTQMESFSASHNELVEFPDIFNAKSAYVFQSVDFSYNKIERFANGDKFKGVNASQINLSDNHIKTFPAILFKTDSPMNYLVLAGNGMEKFPKGSLEGNNAFMLEALDLSYNYLTGLPVDFSAQNLPYLTGIDLSYNRFSEFPTEPLSIAKLSRFFIRYQRDKDGNRTLKEWPEGIMSQAQCPSLNFLCMGGNDLRKIEETLSPNVFYFEIADNPNISINISSVCEYIRAGYYMLVYDVTQDIRGCDAIKLER